MILKKNKTCFFSLSENLHFSTENMLNHVNQISVDYHYNQLNNQKTL